MRTLKKAFSSVLRFLLLPLSIIYRRHNGTPERANRKELPNEHFLPLVSESLAKGLTATIWVRGYSMRPFIEHERDRVKLTAQDEYHIGDAVLAQIAPGHYVLHRIIDMQGERVTLQGDGNIRGVEHCTRGDICGVVVEYIRPGRTIPASDPSLRRSIRLWRRLRPVRRVLLFAYRAVI